MERKSMRNKGKRKAYMIEYRRLNRERLLAQAREYKALHKEEIKEQTQVYNELNKEKIKEGMKKYRATPKYRDVAKRHDKKYYEIYKPILREKHKEYYKENKESILDYIKTWKAENPDKVRIYNINRRARKQNACVDGHKVSSKVIKDLLKTQDDKCFYCRVELLDYHIDHYIPLSKGGKHVKENLRISCPTCNLEKYTKMPEEFIKELSHVA